MPAPFISGRRWFALVATVLLVAVLLIVLHRNRRHPAATASGPASAKAAQRPADLRPPFRFTRLNRAGRIEAGAASADAVVQQKLAQFTRSRLELARALAASNHMTLPPKVEAFFAAVAAGDWEGAKRLQVELQHASPESQEQTDGSYLLKQAVKETYGVAEAVHTWPADRLLQYGEAILGALKPGMVYVGGTDGGRFIPTLLNDTADGERHVILTQNALADGTYLAYLRFRYGDQMALLEGEDSQKDFQAYLKEAQARALHDENAPHEAAQLRPGENVKVTRNEDGSQQRVQVSGQVAVMAINERLLTTLMDKNPGMSFALEESFSLPSTYAGALPSGPLLELRAADADNPLTPARAAESLDYWRTVQQDVAVEAPDSELRKSYAKMAVAQANLFARQGLAVEAEQGYRLARELAPALPEAILGLAGLLETNGRGPEARQVLSTLPAGK